MPALILSVVLACSGFALAYSVRHSVIIVLAGYLALSLAYTFVLKHHAIVDVLSIAAGFLLRAVAGAVAVHVPTSGWFLLCSGLGAIFLALEKRRAEIRVLQEAAGAHRPVLQGYQSQLLDRMQSLILPTLLTAYAFYSFLSIHGQWMMLTVPFVVYGVMRYLQLSLSEDGLTGVPEDVLFKDRPIQVAILLWLLTCIGVVYGGIQFSLQALVSALDSIR
jgi:4-hydroxybenzoate polyprenyltransferase